METGKKLPNGVWIFIPQLRYGCTSEALAEFADVMPGAVTQPETNKRSHQAAVAASAAVHSSATSGSLSRAR